MPTLLLALVAGLLAAILIGRATSSSAERGPARVELAEGGVGGALERVPSDDEPMPLREAQALRDGAEALTRAEVELDERAIDLWLPRLALIDEALADPGAAPGVRAELAAARRALLRLGIGGVDADLTAP